MAKVRRWRTLAEVEREYVLDTLRHCTGNRTRAARLLGISTRGLRLKIRQYGAAGFPIPEPGDTARAGETRTSSPKDDGDPPAPLGCPESAGSDRHAARPQRGGAETEIHPARSKTAFPRAAAPDGTLLTLSNLPRPDTRRWVPSRKAFVVSAVKGGLLSLEEACRRYALTREELATWESQVERHGLAGLRTGKVQLYRRAQAKTVIGS
jgi:uncharacterized protein DUF1153/regulatory Fis family protein